METKELLQGLIKELSKDLQKGYDCLHDLTDDEWDEVNKVMGYCEGIKHAITYLTNVFCAI